MPALSNGNSFAQERPARNLEPWIIRLQQPIQDRGRG